MTSSNRIMILFSLSRGRKSLYELSKMLSSDGKKKSSGTLLPIMRKLEEEGYVNKVEAGRIRYYSLTKKGRKHVADLKGLSGEIRRGFLDAFMRQEILITETRKEELLLSPEFVKKVEVVYEKMGEELTDLISLMLDKALKEDYPGIEKMKVKLRDLIGEIKNGVQ